MSVIKNFIYHFFYLLFFAIFVLYEITIASFRVAYAILSPSFKPTPAVIDFPLECTGDIQITILSILITLIPGTLTLEVLPDKKILLLHVMFFSNKQQLIDDIKHQFERPIMEIW